MMLAWTRVLVRSGQMLKVEQTGFADGLDVGSEEKKEDLRMIPKIFGLKVGA